MINNILDPQLAIRGISVEPTPREYWVDYLRGLAALAVALFHFNETQRPEIPVYSDIFGYGWLGVPVFFFLSGYCIQISAQSSRSAYGFLIRRVLRIYLPYWTSLIICCFTIALALAVRGVNDAAPLPKDVLESIILLLAMTGSPYSNDSLAQMNWSYWTLAYELMFYIVIFLAIAARSFYHVMIIFFLALSFFPAFYQYLFFVKSFGLFALGVAVALGKNGKTRDIALLIGIGSLASICWSNESVEVLVTAFLLASLGFFRCTIKPILTKNRFPTLKALGDCSYSLYLIHVPIGIYVFKAYMPEEFYSGYWGLGMDMINIILCCAISALLARVVESRSISMGKSISARLESTV